MKRTFIEQSEKQANPPLMMEDDGVVGQPVTSPGGILHVRAGALEPKFLQTGVDTRLNAENIAQQQQLVREGCFSDLFQALANKRNMTATEVVERIEEKIVLIAPAITALQKETFSPLIMRVLDLLIKSGQIPTPPVKFDMNVVYHGRLAMAMSNMQANAMEAVMAKWSPYMEITPVLENVDLDKAFRKSWISEGAPAELAAVGKGQSPSRDSR